MLKRCVLTCALALAAFVAGAQVTSDFSLVLNPVLNIPLAPKLADGTPF